MIICKVMSTFIVAGEKLAVSVPDETPTVPVAPVGVVYPTMLL